MEKDRFVSCALLKPGFEGRYTGQSVPLPVDTALVPKEHLVDEAGNVYLHYPLWTWTGVPLEWGPEIARINRMQQPLGPFDDETRRIRAEIASLAHCDSGFPVTVDELLAAIGRGRFLEPPFHNGCYYSLDTKSTQPGQYESMLAIEEILRGYLAGQLESEALARFPQAAGFIRRAYRWFGPLAKFTALQKLMLERVLLLFPFFAKRERDYEAAARDFFGEGGRGQQLDAQIAALAGLPKICADYRKEFRETLAGIADPDKKELYRICGALAHGTHTISDCHHSTFRWIENWLYAIGVGKWDIPTRQRGVERARLGRLLFGYILGLDRWLLGEPMQFLLLDLGHVDLGLDPKNEILRVYAYLGEGRSPVKEWLAACLWYHLYASMQRRNAHQALIARAAESGVSLRAWMERNLITEANRET
jgi:hypothetical protein